MQQPKLRFKTDDGDDFPNLEVKRLGDITIPYNVRNKNTLPLEIYSVNNIVGFVPQSEQFDDAGYLRNTDTSIYMIVPPKHFAYNPARIDIGSIGYQYLDHDVQVSSLYEVFKTSDSVDDDFLWMWFHTSYFNHTVKRLQEGGVRLYFYYDKMQETKIGLPSLAEQQKIALLFSELDTLIQSTEKELEGYRELKQCMLQKMFPKNGEKVPQIRFPEFTGDWEEHKLGDVCEYCKGQSVGVNYVGTENMKQDFSGVNDLDSENEAKGVVYNIGDTLMSNIRPYLKKTWKADVNGVCSTDVLVFHPTDINSDYLYRNISSEKFISYVMTAAKGSKMPRGDKEHIMNYDILVPSLEEQKKIGVYFQNLDNLIASQEQELDGYKELKKGLLQQMFC